MSIDKKIVLYLSVLALFGTVTNYVYFSPLLTLLMPLAIYTLNRDELAKPLFWLYAYLVLFLVSVLIYHPLSLVEFEFYRRDGNFLISYAPLLVLPLFKLEFNIQRIFRLFYRFAIVLYGILFLYHLATTNLMAQLHVVVFGGLFYAQNAVGGFLAILGSFGFAYYYHHRNKKELFSFLLVFAMLLATYSRGSILGLVLGIAAWYLAKNRRFKMILAMIAVPVLLTIGTLMIGYPYYQNQLKAGNLAEVELEGDTDVKNANILLRIFYTFPRAYYSFQYSPVFGTGVGSFDDRPYDFEEIIPAVAYNAQPNKSHTDSHAHHSYLHILAEQGIVGLTVFIIFWVYLFWYLMNIKQLPVLRDYLLIAYFTITFAAFTEHRITTPSMMLPFTISLGLVLSHIQPKRNYQLVEEKHE